MKKTKEPQNVLEKGKKKKRNTIILSTIIAIILLLIIGLIANNYIIVGKNKTINLVINNRNVTENLKTGILIQEGEVYISKEDLGNFFDKYIYEDTENNQIITTYNKKIAEIGYDTNTININGSDKTTYTHAIKQNDITYLPIEELKEVYDIEVSYKEAPKVVIIDSLSKKRTSKIHNIRK